MAIAFDAASTLGAEFSADTSWTHTPVGVPRGAILHILGRGSLPATGDIVGATYGGVALARPTNAFAVDASTETGGGWQYFLGASLPTGPQTLAIDVAAVPGSAAFYAYVYTVTAAADTEVVDSDILQDNQANPTMTMNTPVGVNTFIAGSLFSGQPNTGVAVGTDYTQVAEIDLSGARCWSFMRRTAIATGGDITLNWVQATSDDCAAIGIAVREAASGSMPLRRSAETLQHMLIR